MLSYIHLRPLTGIQQTKTYFSSIIVLSSLFLLLLRLESIPQKHIKTKEAPLQRIEERPSQKPIIKDDLDLLTLGQAGASLAML